MTTKDDGGLAFPGKRAENVALTAADGSLMDQWEAVTHPGMTMRAYLAGQFVDAALAFCKHDVKPYDISHHEHVARAALAFADALIAELRK